MPIYEYRCNGCGQRASLFFRSISAAVDPVCPSCKSTDLNRLISRVALLKSTDQQLAKLDEYERYMSEVNNPRDTAEIERWARRVGSELDGELGSSFREMASQINGDDARPYDMYDPRGTLQLALDKKRAELLGWTPPPDPFDEYFNDAPSGTEPDFVKEARDKGALPDGTPLAE